MPIFMPSSAKVFELPPAGIQPAYVYRLIDLGTQTGKSFDGKEEVEAHQFYVGWELAGKQRPKEGGAFTMGKWWKFSAHAKASMRRGIEDMRGVPFANDAEAKAYDITQIVGARCLLRIKHELNSQGEMKAKIGAILCAKDMPDLPFEPAQLKREIFVLEKGFDRDLLKSLPEYLRVAIKSSPEYERLVSSGEKAQNGGSGSANSADEFEAARQAVTAAQSGQSTPAEIDFQGDQIPF